jgi:hypothetical protein
MPNMLSILIYLVIFCIVAGVGYYAITNLVPPPMQKVALVIFYLVCAIFAIYFLVSMLGGGPILAPRFH